MLPSQKNYIIDLFKKALSNLGAPADIKVVLERPKQKNFGDVACTVALQCAKIMGKNPRVIAAEITEQLKSLTKESSFFSDIQIAGPGFINLTISPAAKQEVIKTILSEGKNYGSSTENEGKSLLLEYVSANPTGPLHLGHARQGALGDVLANIFRSQGWKVTREFYYNDAGVQISKLTSSVQARAKELIGEKVDFPEDGYQGLYIYDIAKDYLAKKPIQTFDGKLIESNGDVNDSEAIRRYSVAYLREEQNRDLKALGVEFDNYYLESSLYTDNRVQKAVQAIVDHGDAYEDGGALWFRSTTYGDDKDRVMRKADGTYTYFVPDVAYHLAKFERGFDRALNIQGTDHHGTIARVRAGLQSASSAFGFTIPKDFPEYLLHTMLQVVKDGNPVKMSKRSGSYITLMDLVEWVGKDAARLFLVNRKADAEFTFDVDLAVRQSDENPVYYLQYAHARICSVLEQAKEKGFKVPSEQEALNLDLSTLTSPSAMSLLNKLSDYPDALAVAAKELAPHALVTYLKELSAGFHSFYNDQRILVDDANERNARLALILATRQVLRNGLNILGLNAPERLDKKDK